MAFEEKSPEYKKGYIDAMKRALDDLEELQANYHENRIAIYFSALHESKLRFELLLLEEE